MPHPLLIFSQSDYSRLLIQIQILNGKQCRSRPARFLAGIWSYTHCLQRQGISGFSRTRVDENTYSNVLRIGKAVDEIPDFI